jgi:Purine nucleoside phosphorylase
MDKIKLAIIGGSGLTKIFKEIEEIKHILTPFGVSQPLAISKVGNVRIVYTNRHSLPGSFEFAHVVPPHLINYRAMIYSLAKLGVKRIIAINSVGALRKEFKISSLALPTQFIDFTKKRDYTFFESKYYGDDEILKDLSKVKHIDVTSPFCNELISIIYNKAKEKNEVYLGGCYVCTEGPRLETPAEINFFRMIGCDYVGMTLVPEIILARELGLCYASISVITNYAAGMQERVSLEEVIQVYKSVENKLLNLLEEVIKEIPDERKCNC